MYESMKGVRKLPRKEKSSYNSGNIWDQRENAIFLMLSLNQNILN
jgi:hypothetical protein